MIKKNYSIRLHHIQMVILLVKSTVRKLQNDKGIDQSPNWWSLTNLQSSSNMLNPSSSITHTNRHRFWSEYDLWQGITPVVLIPVTSGLILSLSVHYNKWVVTRIQSKGQSLSATNPRTRELWRETAQGQPERQGSDFASSDASGTDGKGKISGFS